MANHKKMLAKRRRKKPRGKQKILAKRGVPQTKEIARRSTSTGVQDSPLLSQANILDLKHNWKWHGDRDPKEDRLTGRFTLVELMENFEMAFKEKDASGFYHAADWYLQIFGNNHDQWPINALHNYYRLVFEKEIPDVHPVVIKYMTHAKLVLLRFREEVSSGREHQMKSTWENMIPKLENKIEWLRNGDLEKLHDISRMCVIDETKCFDRARKGKVVMGNKKTKKAKKVSKKNSKKSVKKSKKSSTKKSTTEIQDIANESIRQSTLIVGGLMKGVVTRAQLLEAVRERRLKLGLLLKKDLKNDAKMTSLSTTMQAGLKRLIEHGECKRVGNGEYSFDGSKGSVPTKPSKNAKKSGKKSTSKKPKKKVVAKKKRRR